METKEQTQEENLEEKIETREKLKEITDIKDKDTSEEGRKLLVNIRFKDADTYIEHNQNLEEQKQKNEEELVQEYLKLQEERTKRIQEVIEKDPSQKYTLLEKINVTLLGVINPQTAETYKNKLDTKIRKQTAKRELSQLEKEVKSEETRSEKAKEKYKNSRYKEHKIINSTLMKDTDIQNYQKALEQQQKENERIMQDQQTCYEKGKNKEARMLQKAKEENELDTINWEDNINELSLEMESDYDELDRNDVEKAFTYTNYILSRKTYLGLKQKYKSLKSILENNEYFETQKGFTEAMKTLKYFENKQERFDSITEESLEDIEKLPLKTSFTKPVKKSLKERSQKIEEYRKREINERVNKALEIGEAVRKRLYE